jgi:hypothetical protein
LLLDQARQAGAHVLQPWSVEGLKEAGAGFCCRARCRDSGAPLDLHGSIVVAAHGSWEPGTLPTQRRRQPPRPGDLLGFKAHFLNDQLPPGLMPLLSFPGGYGGMVHTDGGRVSLSCCVRHDRLTALRAGMDGDAGDAVLEHLCRSCRGAREALAGATRDGPWLAAGPIRPGIRLQGRPGIFPVGNAAGEAHPVVARRAASCPPGVCCNVASPLRGPRACCRLDRAMGHAAARHRRFLALVAPLAAASALGRATQWQGPSNQESGVRTPQS